MESEIRDLCFVSRATDHVEKSGKQSVRARRLSRPQEASLPNDGCSRRGYRRKLRKTEQFKRKDEQEKRNTYPTGYTLGIRDLVREYSTEVFAKKTAEAFGTKIFS